MPIVHLTPAQEYERGLITAEEYYAETGNLPPGSGVLFSDLNQEAVKRYRHLKEHDHSKCEAIVHQASSEVAVNQAEHPECDARWWAQTLADASPFDDCDLTPVSTSSPGSNSAWFFFDDADSEFKVTVTRTRKAG